MTENRESYLNWMKGGRRTSDLNILRQIIIDSSDWKCDSMPLDETLFEKSFHLVPLPRKTLSIESFKKELNYEMVKELIGHMKFLKPTGRTARQQIESILPRNLELTKSDVRDTKSLSYIFARIATDRMPKKTKLPLVVPGLDCLSAAILSVYSTAQTTGQNVQWLYHLWSFRIEEFKTKILERILDGFSNVPEAKNLSGIFDDAEEKVRLAFGDDDPFLTKIVIWAREAQETKKDAIKILERKISEETARLKGFTDIESKGTIEVRDIPATPLNILALRPDGPPASKYERLLQLLRQEINILRYTPSVRLLIRLSNNNKVDRITAEDIEETSQFRGRSAYYALERIENFIHERYIPSLNRLGLRYRYIFTPRQRPGVLSDGLVERMILNEQDIRGCTVHTEPPWTNGPDPRTFPEGSFEAVVEDEVLSMRLNKYDVENNRWELDVSDKVPKKTDRRNGYLEWSTHTGDNETLLLTDRQIELVSILWGFEGSRTSRKWLLDRVGYPYRTANRLLHQMREQGVLKLLYHPALEFCGLPDGLIVVANCFDRRSRNSLIGQLSERLPYVRVLFGDSNDVVAHARIPPKMSDIISGKIREVLKETSDHSFAGRLRETKTFRMTVLHRIRNSNTQSWKDIWLA
jgi:hypothetical protein